MLVDAKVSAARLGATVIALRDTIFENEIIPAGQKIDARLNGEFFVLNLRVNSRQDAEIEIANMCEDVRSAFEAFALRQYPGLSLIFVGFDSDSALEVTLLEPEGKTSARTVEPTECTIFTAQPPDVVFTL